MFGCLAGVMAGEFSFAELVQARQSRRKKKLVQTSTVPSTKAISSHPRDPPSVQQCERYFNSACYAECEDRS